jgi:putative DNA primase/helicase
MQTPLDFAAAAAIVALAGCVNRRAVILPKVEDDSWRVTPNLWGAVIAPPGFMKSPVLQAITSPLKKIEAGWRDEYTILASDYEVEAEKSQITHQAWREQYKVSIKRMARLLSLPKSRRFLPCRSVFWVRT